MFYNCTLFRPPSRMSSKDMIKNVKNSFRLKKKIFTNLEYLFYTLVYLYKSLIFKNTLPTSNVFYMSYYNVNKFLIYLPTFPFLIYLVIQV